MMGIFNDLKATANAVGKMATDVVDISKLKITSSELTNEISEKYEELGRTVYEAKKSGTMDNNILINKIAQLDVLIKQLNDIENQIAVLKNKIKCNECGYDNDNKAVYCMKCGAKLQQPETNCSCNYSEVECNDNSCNDGCTCENSNCKEENLEKIEVCDCKDSKSESQPTDESKEKSECKCNDEKAPKEEKDDN